MASNPLWPPQTPPTEGLLERKKIGESILKITFKSLPIGEVRRGL
jgi:hypothetical protein